MMAEGRIRQMDPEALAHVVNGAVLEAALWVAESPRAPDRLGRAQSALGTLLDCIDFLPELTRVGA